MAENITGNLVYYVTLPVTDKDSLAGIRHWQHLKIAMAEDEIWVKDFLPGETVNAEVQSLPSKNIYYAKDNKLFKQGSLLPERLVPALLWTPIERALPVTLPSFNHNYFGVDEVIDIHLKRVTKEVPATMLQTTVQVLKSYIENAPAVRLKDLQWTMLEQNQVIVFGTPLLPLPGVSYWQCKSFFMPGGFDFELRMLADIIQDTINPEKTCWIVWQEDSTYFKIEKHLVRPLTIASFRATINQ